MEIVRDYKKDDAGPICHLFYETVRSVNLGDYSPGQVRAWAPPAPATWHERMSGRHTLVAEGDDGLVGFVDLEEEGHLDMLYCRRDRVGRGVGSRLYAAAEERARSLGLGGIYTEASITARPFFERHGVELVNFSMDKILRPSGAGRPVR